MGVNRLKAEVLLHYGTTCQTCGQDDHRVLQIDHVNNNGAEERRRLGSGHKFYRHLRREGWPSGYQTLCANCNLIKHAEFREMNKETPNTFALGVSDDRRKIVLS